MTADIVNIVFCLVCVVVAIVYGAPSSKLPKGFKQCKISDPNLNECIRDGLQSAIPHLAKGVPSLGIIPMDPLRITELKIDQGSGPVSIKLNFNDLDIMNLKMLTVDKIKYDSEKYILYAELLPKQSIVLQGNYEITGKVLILPIVGKGKCKIILDTSKIYGTVTMKPVVKNEMEYLEIDDISWKFIATNLNLKFNNLFNGDKALGDNMNVFLNENWREVIIELQPAIEEVFGSAFKGIGQQFLNRIPFNQIVTD
ncbi:protein takeout-like [Sipha flava]|uniref:Protein takeout-like n=2 Tax=Sipha flava TaxID=143950 RepID=A0A8B8F9E9_9HEMI|nr:protein takeout-like [Sipha flava]